MERLSRTSIIEKPPRWATSRARRLVSKNARLFFAALFLCFSAGCSSVRFNRDWKDSSSISAVEGDVLAGRWEGQWMSDVNGHHGSLRCLIAQEPSGRYKARFHAKYQRILAFNYDVLLDIKRDDGIAKFHGTADLGWYAGGEFTYEGIASENEFEAVYQSKHDHGTFEMRRPNDPRLSR